MATPPHRAAVPHQSGLASAALHATAVMGESSSFPLGHAPSRAPRASSPKARLRGSVTSIIGIVAVASSAAFARGSFRSSLALVETAKQRELQNAARVIQSSMDSVVGKAAARAALVQDLPPVQEAFRAGDSELLGKLLIPAFQRQRDLFGVREAQFHHAPAISVLRLLGPTTVGEDLSGFREAVLATNRRHEPQKGIEIGRRGLSIRGIVELKDARGPIGSFEVGMDFSPVLEAVKDIAGFEAGVFIDDALLRTVATQLPPPDPERVIGGLRNVEATNWQVIRPLITPDLLTRSTGVVTKTLSLGGSDFGLTLVPVLDFKGTPIGSVVAVREFEAYANQIKSALVNTLAMAVAQAIVLLSVIVITVNTLLMRPLAALRERVGALLAGKRDVGFSDLGGGDEIGRLAEHMAALQASAPPRDPAPEPGEASAGVS